MVYMMRNSAELAVRRPAAVTGKKAPANITLSHPLQFKQARMHRLLLAFYILYLLHVILSSCRRAQKKKREIASHKRRQRRRQ
jgi:hypothetical protein